MLGSPGKVPPGDKKGKPTAVSEEAQLVKLQRYIQKKGAAPTFPKQISNSLPFCLGCLSMLMDADQFKPNTLSRSVEDEDHFVFVCPQDMTITRMCSELFCFCTTLFACISGPEQYTDCQFFDGMQTHEKFVT